MTTDDTFPGYHDNDVTNALSHNGNEFAPTPERELLTIQTEEECFQLGRESRPLRAPTGKRIQKKRRTFILLDSLAVKKVKRNFPWEVSCRHCRSHQLHRQTARGLLNGDRRRGYVPLCHWPSSRQGIRIPV